MGTADINRSSCDMVALCLGYTLLKLGTNWLSFVENNYNSFTTACQFITILLTSKFCIFGYYKAIIEWISTNFFFVFI